MREIRVAERQLQFEMSGAILRLGDRYLIAVGNQEESGIRLVATNVADAKRRSTATWVLQKTTGARRGVRPSRTNSDEKMDDLRLLE
jgi:hypothetical protein